jgi:putative glycosyltransferase (TIGR04372 family)
MNTPQRSTGLAQFLSKQVSKTIKDPARLIIIPWSFVRSPLLKIFGPAIPFLRGTLPAILIPERFRSLSTDYYFVKGHRFLDDNRPREAWRYFSKCLESSTNPFHFVVAAACLLVGLGRFRDALATLTRANALRAINAKRLEVDKRGIRYLDPIWIAAFGHLAQLQYVIKLNILENRRREDTVLYLPSDVPIANRFLLEQWRPFIKITDDERDLPLSLEALRSLTFDFYAPRLADGSTVYYWDAASRVNRRWIAENRGPLLTMPPEIERRGQAALASVGIQRDQWFVTLHVRESGSKKHHADLHNALNGDIADYLPAITEITNRGGWVIRMGDPSMKALPKLPNVLDYCHSTLRADWMDVFLLAKCRFFLGTSSGPTYVPGAYGVPSVLTNWWPYAQRPWDEKAIFLPKLYRRLRNGLPLTLSQALSEPFGYCNSTDHLAKREGVTVENNAPDDIRDATIEMMERLDGTVRYEPSDVELREKAERIFDVGGAHGVGTLARDFLRRNMSIVD